MITICHIFLFVVIGCSMIVVSIFIVLVYSNNIYICIVFFCGFIKRFLAEQLLFSEFRSFLQLHALLIYVDHLVFIDIIYFEFFVQLFDNFNMLLFNMFKKMGYVEAVVD